MTKSRTRPALFLPCLFLSLPAAAQVPSAPVAAGIVAAPPDPLGDLAARQRRDQEGCSDGAMDSIVVCGRLARGGGGYRIPYRPEPGARVHLIAGEAPSAMGAMNAGGCLRLCEQPVMFNLLDPGSIARGLDRILGGD
jgi:hypothetical protein